MEILVTEKDIEDVQKAADWLEEKKFEPRLAEDNIFDPRLKKQEASVGGKKRTRRPTNLRRTRKLKRTRRLKRTRVKARGLTPISQNANVPCCVCDREFSRESMFIPLACLQKNRERAHRICQDCWWDPQIGFARENAHHGCPGCKRGLPLNPPIKTRKPIRDEIIVISD